MLDYIHIHNINDCICCHNNVKNFSWYNVYVMHVHIENTMDNIYIYMRNSTASAVDIHMFHHSSRDKLHVIGCL